MSKHGWSLATGLGRCCTPPDHGALAVWVWATYQTLMAHWIGGRIPASARRQFVAERAGTSTTALDDARRELLAATSDGAFLSRSAPRGSKRSVKAHGPPTAQARRDLL